MNQIFLIAILFVVGLTCLVTGGMSLKKCKLGGILLMIIGTVCVVRSGYLGFKNKRGANVTPTPLAAAVPH
jgi:hypothetical protein